MEPQIPMQWTHDRGLDEHHSPRRGAWQGVVWSVGTRWHATLQQTSSMIREDGQRFDDQSAAMRWAEQQLVERVPIAEPEQPPIDTARGVVLPPAPPQPELIACPVCRRPFLPSPLIDHLRAAHPTYKLRIVDPKRPRRYREGVSKARCAICNAVMPATSLLKHIRRKHDTRSRSQVICGFCGAYIPMVDYADHIWDQHLSA